MLRAFVDLDALDGIVALLVGAAARRASTRRSPSAGRAPSCSCSGRASRPACRSATTTRARSAPDRIANAVAARERHGAPAVVVDFGTSTNFDVVNAGGRLRRRRARAGGRDLDGRALRARGAAAAGAVRRAGARDQPDDDGRPAVGPRLRLRRAGRRDRRRASATSSAPPTRRSSRRAASPT